MTTLTIIVFLTVVFILFRSKKKIGPTNSNTLKQNYVPYSLEDEKEDDHYLYPNFGEFELKGVHISKRKNHILTDCMELDDVKLVFDVDNKYSKTATAVLHKGRIIGYLSSTARQTVDFNLSMKHKAEISSINYDEVHLYVNIDVYFDKEALVNVKTIYPQKSSSKPKHQSAFTDREEDLKPVF